MEDLQVSTKQTIQNFSRYLELKNLTNLKQTTYLRSWYSMGGFVIDHLYKRKFSNSAAVSYLL